MSRKKAHPRSSSPMRNRETNAQHKRPALCRCGCCCRNDDTVVEVGAVAEAMDSRAPRRLTGAQCRVFSATWPFLGGSAWAGGGGWIGMPVPLLTFAVFLPPPPPAASAPLPALTGIALRHPHDREAWRGLSTANDVWVITLDPGAPDH